MHENACPTIHFTGSPILPELPAHRTSSASSLKGDLLKSKKSKKKLTRWAILWYFETMFCGVLFPNVKTRTDLEEFNFFADNVLKSVRLQDRFIRYYYMATKVRAVWLAAERALFSCNDRALFFFSRLDGSFELWVKNYVRMGENNRKDGQSTTIFSITERKTSIQILL